MNPDDLSVPQLKKFRKHSLELFENSNSEEGRFNAKVTLGMLDKELESRGFDTKKLFGKSFYNLWTD